VSRLLRWMFGSKHKELFTDRPVLRGLRGVQTGAGVSAREPPPIPRIAHYPQGGYFARHGIMGLQSGVQRHRMLLVHRSQ